MNYIFYIIILSIQLLGTSVFYEILIIFAITSLQPCQYCQQFPFRIQEALAFSPGNVVFNHSTLYLIISCRIRATDMTETKVERNLFAIMFHRTSLTDALGG